MNVHSRLTLHLHKQNGTSLPQKPATSFTFVRLQMQNRWESENLNCLYSNGTPKLMKTMEHGTTPSYILIPRIGLSMVLNFHSPDLHSGQASQVKLMQEFIGVKDPAQTMAFGEHRCSTISSTTLHDTSAPLHALISARFMVLTI